MRKRFADGKVSMPYKQFMGYRRSKNGNPEIVEAEAQIVRTIDKVIVGQDGKLNFCFRNGMNYTQ